MGTMSLRVVHDIPGRLRVRLPPGVPTGGLEAALAAEPGVIGSVVSSRTRSVLVLYDLEHGDRNGIVEAVARSTGLERLADDHGSGQVASAVHSEPGAMLAMGMREMVGEIDQRVRHASRGLIGLAGLMPVALTAWALAELVRGRAAPLAWSSALWYAHGLYRDYLEPVTPD
jgi:hypothetical protein